MNELVLEGKKVVRVKLDDKFWDVRKPNNRELYEFGKSSKADESLAVETMINFLEKLGLPSEVVWELDPESINKIVEALMPKKNS